MQPVLTPAEMAAADQHAIAAGTPEAVLIERAGTRGRPSRAADARRHVRPAGRRDRGQGQQRRRRASRPRGTCGRAGSASRSCCSRSRSAGSSCGGRWNARTSSIDAMYGTGFRGGLDGRRGDGGGCAEGVDRTPCSRSTSRRESTARRELSRGTAVRAHETICFAAYKPGLLFEPGSSFAGRVSVADIGIEVAGRSRARGARRARSRAAAAGHAVAQVVVGMSRRGRLERHGRRAAARGAAPQLRCGAGMVVCAVPGASAAAQVSGRELVARALPATPAGALDATRRGRGARRDHAVPGGRDRSRPRPRRRHTGGGPPHRRRGRRAPRDRRRRAERDRRRSHRR